MSTVILTAAINDFAATPEVEARPVIVKHLLTAINKYVLPHLLKAVESINAQTFDFDQIDLNQIDLADFLPAFDLTFGQAVLAEQVSKHTKGNYRSALHRFVEFCKKRLWYRESHCQKPPEYAPKHTGAWRDQPAKRTKAEMRYGLIDDEMPPQILMIKQALSEFWLRSYQCLTPNTTIGLPLQQAQSATERRQAREQRRQQLAAVGGELIKPNVQRIEQSTFDRYWVTVKVFYGWCVNIEGYQPSELQVDWLFDLTFLNDYSHWLVNERECTDHAVWQVYQTGIFIAKWRFYSDSSHRDWGDIDIVRQLRNLRANAVQIYKSKKVGRDAAKWEQKAITHEQAREVVQYLYSLCAEKGAGGELRHPSAVTMDYQIYLMVKILVYAPIRQEELRKFIFGKTLLRVTDKNGIQRYAVRLKHHKNVNKTQKPRFYPLPTILTPDLDYWIESLRPRAVAAPQTDKSWLQFWGKHPDAVGRMQNRITQAEERLDAQTQPPKALLELQNRFRQVKQRLETREIAQQNIEGCEYIFFSLGGNQFESYGKPYVDKDNYITELVSRGVARATKALYQTPKFLNPHGFRHIGAKHLRTIGNSRHKEAFSALAGHSIEIDDEYAAQVTQDFEVIEDMVDDWWLQDL